MTPMNTGTNKSGKNAIKKLAPWSTNRDGSILNDRATNNNNNPKMLPGMGICMVLCKNEPTAEKIINIQT